MPRAPHDAFFKRLFSDLDVAREVLRALLPRALSDLLDWSTLQLAKGSFVSKKLRARHTDLFYSIQLKGTQRSTHATSPSTAANLSSSPEPPVATMRSRACSAIFLM